MATSPAPDYSLIWAQNSPLSPYSFSSENYLTGWNFIGAIPPDRRMFDAWMNRADNKMKWLYDNAMYESDMDAYLFIRTKSTAYVVGDKRRLKNGPLDIFLECVSAGTTASTELYSLPSSATVGSTFDDGTVTWKVMRIADQSSAGGGGYNTREVITTSGTYTAPVTGWYKITIKGGGGGGSGALYYGTIESIGGSGGGEGGTTIAYEKLTAGDTLSIVIGAGGAGGVGKANAGDVDDGKPGQSSSVVVNGNTYTAGGGTGGSGVGGRGGAGTIRGACGGPCQISIHTAVHGVYGSQGGGAGGSQGGMESTTPAGVDGGGGGGGMRTINGANNGSRGGNGYVWLEYYNSSLDSGGGTASGIASNSAVVNMLNGVFGN